MKRNILLLMILILSAVIFTAGCGGPQQIIDTAEMDGSLALNVFIPDYSKDVAASSEASARVIDPLTETLTLYLDGVFYREIELFDTSAGTLTVVDAGFEWAGTVDVPVPLSGIFAEIRLEFADADGTVLSVGSLEEQAVAAGETLPLGIGCLPADPTELGANNGADILMTVTDGLAAWETAYYSFSSDVRRTHTITVMGEFGSDPDLFLFDSTGRNILSSTDEGMSAELSFISETVETYYFGVFGATILSSYDLTLANVNQPPVVVVSPDTEADTGTAVVLSGEGSSDPEGGVLTYSWTLEGTELGTGVELTHTFSEGIHDVSLTVADDDGAEASAVVTVYVDQANIAPVADAGEDQVVKESDTVSFSAAGSYDPNADDSLEYIWDFDSLSGDGANDEDAATVETSHQYLDPGVYEVTLTVSDGTAYDFDTMTVTVLANAVPVADAGADREVLTNESVSFSATASYDEDSDSDDLTYSWDFGDAIDSSDQATGLAADYTYTDPGTYTVTLTVEDELEAIDTATVTVVVEASFKFNLTYSGSNDFDSEHPLVAAVFDTGTGEIVYSDSLGADGTVTCLTTDLYPVYDPEKDYILLVIHDMDNDFDPAYPHFVVNDPLDYIGVYTSDADAVGGLLYSITAEDFVLADSKIEPASYDIDFSDVEGSIVITVQ